MPIYEYECTSCHHHFDLMRKISDEPVKQCPHCNKNTAVKLISAAGFQLKGTGWYATDFKDKKDKNTSAPEDTQAKTKEPETSTKTSTKEGSSSEN